jgi:hypothetical protein
LKCVDPQWGGVYSRSSPSEPGAAGYGHPQDFATIRRSAIADVETRR